MIFIVHSRNNETSIRENLGLEDYSYFFVLKEYLPILEKIGRVIQVTNPRVEVDVIYKDCVLRGEFCVYLSFVPPHKTIVDVRCPTVPVFAWEYSKVPIETWGNDERNDWRFTLGKCGWGITHSSYTVEAVRDAMTDAFPVVSAPAPVWDRYSKFSKKDNVNSVLSSFSVNINATVFDSFTVDFEKAFKINKDEFISRQVRECLNSNNVNLNISGVVYNSVFNPNDGRKNWFDLVRAFCWAFQDKKDASLIIKLTHHDPVFSISAVVSELYDLPYFKCRVIAVQGYLSEDQYRKLLVGSTYTVNSSHGEGQCLPLMESMSAGKPAISPNHTAMSDYVSEENSFIVKSSRELYNWPHDPRLMCRTFRYRINWKSLLDAYNESYAVAKSDPTRYINMSKIATKNLKSHCSQRVVEKKLRRFFWVQKQSQLLNKFGSNIVVPLWLILLCVDLNYYRDLIAGFVPSSMRKFFCLPWFRVRNYENASEIKLGLKQ